MDKTTKRQKNIVRQNVIESLKDIGGGTINGLKSDVLRPGDFMEQLFGPPKIEKYSGEINPGEALEINDVFSGEREEKQKVQKQLALERKLRAEESERFEKKSNELKLQLHAIMEEVKLLAETTQELGQEVQVASLQAPVEPGVYHVIFFEKLLEFLKSFRKKIEAGSIWLQATNKRAEKKNYWARYKKHGGKFLLSPDHYLTRNAG